MSFHNTKVKITIFVMGIFAYIMLLLYISSIQTDYNVQIHTQQECYKFSADESEDYVIEVEVNNKANRMLSSAEGQNIFLSYHLYDVQGNLICFDNKRSRFEHNILSGDAAKVKLYITPLKKGEYIVGIDVMQEFVTWFHEKEDTEKKVRVLVE